MPGINLSQSAMQSEQGHSEIHGIHLSSQFIGSAVAVLFALAAWGGLTYYDGRLQSEIDVMTESINAKNSGFSGEDVDRVADFSLRTGLLDTNLKGKIDPSALLISLQNVMFDSIVLSDYSYDQKSGLITIGGNAESFRSLARQLVAFRKLPGFKSLSIGHTSREDDGKITFDAVITVGATTDGKGSSQG